MKKSNLVEMVARGIISKELEPRIIRQMESPAESHIESYSIVKVYRRDDEYHVWFNVTHVDGNSNDSLYRGFSHVFDRFSDGVKMDTTGNVRERLNEDYPEIYRGMIDAEIRNDEAAYLNTIVQMTTDEVLAHLCRDIMDSNNARLNQH